MNKTKIIKNALKFKYQHSGNVVFWLKDPDIIPQVDSFASALEKYGQSRLPGNIECIKPVHRRLVFVIKPSTIGGKGFVAKVFTLYKLRIRLKYCLMKYNRYKFAEAANLIIARKRGMKVPRVYGYGRINGLFGLIEKDILLLEYLNHHISVGELLEKNKENKEKCIDILGRAIPVFVSFYNARCNSWDINPGSIMLNLKDPNTEPFALDFEYVIFYKKKSLEVLAHLAANFAKGFSGWMNREIIDSWVIKLLDRVEIADVNIRKNFTNRFNYYMNIRNIPHKLKMNIQQENINPMSLLFIVF